MDEHMLGLAARPDRYRRFTARPFRRIHDRVVTDVVRAALPDGARILDVGTGPGNVPIRIGGRLPGVHVDGIDLSARMIAHAADAADAAGVADRVRFFAEDAAHTSYDDGTFDLVISSMSQHHWPDVPGVLAELRRILRPDGRVWIYDARMALGRCEQAARGYWPAAAVRRDVVRTGRVLPALFARLSVDAAR
jgi:ubiquinone/menaquinone biosynthesis C-methylase UbiE